jgi:hypothetical protein
VVIPTTLVYVLLVPVTSIVPIPTTLVPVSELRILASFVMVVMNLTRELAFLVHTKPTALPISLPLLALDQTATYWPVPFAVEVITFLVASARLATPNPTA